MSYDSAGIFRAVLAGLQANLLQCGLMRVVRVTIRFGLVLLLCVAILKPLRTLAAQQAQAAGRILLATVVDVTGKTQVDFGVDDFVIQEGGDEREVLDVHVADYPVVVLIDDVPESTDLGPMTSAVARFVTRIGERPVAIGTLSNPSALVASLEDSREDVLERLTKMTSKPGEASTLPSVAHAAGVLKTTGSPFSAIVVVTGRAIDARIPVEGDLLPSIVDSGAAVHVVESQASHLDGDRREHRRRGARSAPCPGRSNARSIHDDFFLGVVRRGARSTGRQAVCGIDDSVSGSARRGGRRCSGGSATTWIAGRWAWE